jgi:flavorubredoxin
MSFVPMEPAIRVEPEEIAPETYLIHQVQDALGAPLSVYLNSMVIRGEEPVIVDTGTIANRKQWLDDVFGLVEPDDVKWVFLSHDDIDHTGNLEQVMAECRNATLVASWAIVERHSNAFEFPLERTRWVSDGESFDVGDRRLVAVRPPQFDSPTTRGLYDPSSGVYWAVDAFATPMPGGPVGTVAELDPNFWREGMTMFVLNALSPWISWVDPARYAQACAASRDLGMRTIAGAHTPLITAESIDAAYELAAALPGVEAPPVPDQSVLDAVLGLGDADG